MKMVGRFCSMFGEAGFILKGRETPVFTEVTSQPVDENKNKSRGWSPVGVSFFRLLFSNAEIREKLTAKRSFTPKIMKGCAD